MKTGATIIAKESRVVYTLLKQAKTKPGRIYVQDKHIGSKFWTSEHYFEEVSNG